MPKPPRTTVFGLTRAANPIRGEKSFRSFLTATTLSVPFLVRKDKLQRREVEVGDAAARFAEWAEVVIPHPEVQRQPAVGVPVILEEPAGLEEPIAWLGQVAVACGGGGKTFQKRRHRISRGS